MSNPGSSFGARVVALLGGCCATFAGVAIHQVSALPLGLTLDLAPLVGAEIVMPWAIAIGLVLLGWVPLLFPRTGWLIGMSVFALGVLALFFADFGAYVLGTAAAFLAAFLLIAAANLARRARRAARARVVVPDFV